MSGLLEELAKARAEEQADVGAGAGVLGTREVVREPPDLLSQYEVDTLKLRRERLRDQLAGQALVGLLANPGVVLETQHTPLERVAAERQRFTRYAEAAYALADAMLIARDKAPSP